MRKSSLTLAGQTWPGPNGICFLGKMLHHEAARAATKNKAATEKGHGEHEKIFCTFRAFSVFISVAPEFP